MSQRDEMERVKNQIRALSQKTVSNGCTEEEAQYAMEKVGELLDRYNLSMNEVILSEHKCVTMEWGTGRKTRSAFDTVIPDLKSFCDCLVYYKKIRKENKIEGHYVFFGLEPDVQMALYLCDIVDAALKTETNKFKQTNQDYLNKVYPRKTLTANFQAGFADRIRDRFVDLNEKRRQERMQNQEAIAEGTSTDIDIVHLKQEKVKSEAKETLGWIPGTRKKQSSGIRSYSAFDQGRAAANNVNLDRPLSGGSRPKGQLPC